jgi:glyoxylase-like metal-dependent hydrolase (beta-lactamase superfamily II)
MVRPSQILGNASGAFPAPAPWQTQEAVPLLRNVLRLTAPNPGLMTGPGTNSYLVGDAACGFTVIDPGPADPDHVRRLWATARYPDGTGGNIIRIVCTHSHPDHAPAALPLQALCARQPAIAGLPSAPTARSASAFTPDKLLLNGELLTHIPCGEAANLAMHNSMHTLQVVYTPGHAANHICLVLPQDGVLFSGDHILNGSTTVVDPPDGDMHDYIDSLDALYTVCRQDAVQHILPAHGDVIHGALDAISGLKAHRLQREAKIAAVMRENPRGTLDDWLPLAYDDVPVRIWPVARRSLLAHVQRIQALQSSGIPS